MVALLPDAARLFAVFAHEPTPAIPLQKVPRVPQAAWPEIQANAAAGYSLRALAAGHGVSHETIRRIVDAAGDSRKLC